MQRRQSYTLKSSDNQCKATPIYPCLLLTVQRSAVKEADLQMESERQDQELASFSVTFALNDINWEIVNSYPFGNSLPNFLISWSLSRETVEDDAVERTVEEALLKPVDISSKVLSIPENSETVSGR
ncbi:hypothetical protein RCL_jg20528.t1 [Rhizophagus clarus]|uniref:Uncharacterized protein n=1 Tax=Rhizophagus clarus TaxID=94130 RepID=A0A8H3LQQ1_9GLOM|nr:hypothetical protein RCL_jg20528.t1 [Rhizophagus clarus]